MSLIHLIIFVQTIFEITICQQIDKLAICKQKQQSILQGYFSNKNFNIMNYNSLIINASSGAYFCGSLINSSLLRDQIYYVGNCDGFTYCQLGKKISISLLQEYFINTLKLYIYDIDLRVQNFVIKIGYRGHYQIILDNISEQSGIITVSFNPQKVDHFELYNRGGNSANTFLVIIKALAYFKF